MFINVLGHIKSMLFGAVEANLLPKVPARQI